MRCCCLLATLPLLAALAQPAHATQSTGNAPAAPSPCLDISQVNNQLTPPQLYIPVISCVREGKMEPILPQYLLGSAYAHFDQARVADSSAHQARAVLEQRLRERLGPASHDVFLQLVQDMANAGQLLAPLCAGMARIGPPAYHPEWMINHGRGPSSPAATDRS